MAANGHSAGLDASLSSLNSLDNDTSATSSANIDSQPSNRWPSTTTSLTASPAESRDPSPTRPPVKSGRTSRAAATTTTTTTTARSRKNSAQESSPQNARANRPAASAASRQTLPSAATPPVSSSSEPPPRASAAQKPLVAAESSKDSHRWPISPRLKSPPPQLARPAVATPAPAINVQRATPSPHVESASQHTSDNEAEDCQLPSGMRTPGRNLSNASTTTLETVQEVSQPNTPTPRPGLDADVQQLNDVFAAQDDRQSGRPEQASSNKAAKSSQNATNSESGSDSGSHRPYKKRSGAAPAAPLLHSRQSSSALKFSGRGQASGESSSKNMTVETEEVKNMPQMSLIPNAGGTATAGGSLRTRPSTETIKPKKEKKRHSRKPTSVPAGNASSKADIFEAKVASAVEEADSSDSDETFVYDSNPPDAPDRPRRYHSRTPSATSMISQVDRNNMRSIHHVLEGGPHNPPIKKNMKFVNTFTGIAPEGVLGEDDGRGSSRSNAGSARGSGRHPHHPGRWGRNNGSSHLSLFDQESPFPSAGRAKFSGISSRQSSNPPSPRFANSRNWVTNGKRQMTLPGSYDMDDTTGADDERTPLLAPGTARSARSTRSRRSQLHRNLEAQTYHRQAPSFLNRFASCLVLTVMLLLVITGAIGFMFATSQPLTDIELVKIGNVLASETELMMDVTVKAHNPNVVVVMIDSADLEVFAKSPHAGDESQWWRHPHGDELGILDDPKNDPPIIDDPPTDDSSPNMRLGNILTFDSPLSYEGSFFQSGISTSTGELRLSQPGNGTDSGTERWERIISEEFTLIVKGVLKYTLPLSQRVRSVAISGKTTVKPNSANDPSLRPNRTEVELY